MRKRPKKKSAYASEPPEIRDLSAMYTLAKPAAVSRPTTMR
jgi:hypothetical protein